MFRAEERSKRYDEAEARRRKWLAAVKGRAGTESREYAAELSGLGANLLRQERWADAVPVLRQSLAVLEEEERDAWETQSTRSLLGGALLGPCKYAEAEPLLVRGYEGVGSHEGRIPPPERN